MTPRLYILSAYNESVLPQTHFCTRFSVVAHFSGWRNNTSRIAVCVLCPVLLLHSIIWPVVS